MPTPLLNRAAGSLLFIRFMVEYRHMKNSFSELAEKEQQNIEKVKAQEPSFFARDPQIDDEETLKKVGIFGLPADRPLGYIKLWPQDFVVEELDKENKLHSVLPDDGEVFKDDTEGGTIYADLTKVGLSTIDVREELSRALALEEKFIGSAGIKDRDALTSQLMSFRRVEKRQVENLSFPNFFFKNIRQGKGVVDKGMLNGNRFTITVRLSKGQDASSVAALAEDLSKNGFWNFYYLQRFGTPRLLTHIWGLYTLRGEYEQAVKTMMLKEGAREIPFFKELRRQAGESWGDWATMEEIFAFFPLSFRSDLAMLRHLKENPTDFRGALAQIPQQVQLGVYAYSSFLFNCVLSTYIQRREDPPSALPIVLSRKGEQATFYKPFLERHNLRLPSGAFYDFSFIQRAEHDIPTRVEAEVHSCKVLPNNLVVIDFSLPKAAYATSFLAQIFTLVSGKPVIKGIHLEQLDPFPHLGRESLQPTIDRFQDVIFAKFEEDEVEGGN